ncbi:MAG: DUF5329 family protein [Deltaproteobacteria bacterium]
MVLSAVPSFADVPDSQKPEVEHLLTFVRNTDCKFERNGTMYDGGRAYSHINKKYGYFRDEITSTETFIEYSATKSTMSGKFYFVHCADSEPVKSGDWLLRELINFRGQSKSNR